MGYIKNIFVTYSFIVFWKQYGIKSMGFALICTQVKNPSSSWHINLDLGQYSCPFRASVFYLRLGRTLLIPLSSNGEVILRIKWDVKRLVCHLAPVWVNTKFSCFTYGSAFMKVLPVTGWNFLNCFPRMVIPWIHLAAFIGLYDHWWHFPTLCP